MGPTSRIGNVSRLSARVVQKADSVTWYASQPTTTSWSQNPDEANRVDNQRNT